MPNNYARFSVLKAEVTIPSTATSLDDRLKNLIERVSRQIDQHRVGHFYSKTATYYLDGDGGALLWLPVNVEERELISVTTLKVDEDGDGVYEKTLTASTDYWLWPNNRSPKGGIDLNPQSSNLSAWTKGRRRIEIAGKWGYSEDTEALTGAGLLNEALDDSETAVDVDASHGLEAGDTILVESEQMYVSSVSTNTLTVVRGANGTTAATHADDTAVRHIVYPADVTQAVLLQALRWTWEMQKGYDGISDASGGYTRSTLYPMVQDLLRPYTPKVVFS